MHSFKSCLVCEAPLAADSVAELCISCTPLYGRLRGNEQPTLSNDTVPVPSDEDDYPSNDPSELPGVLTDVAAAGRFETAKADENHDIPLNLSSLPDVPGHELIHELGQGSGGKVYQARHRATGRVVAVKIVPGGDPIDRERFFREVRVLARFHHPTVVEIYEVGECDRGLYFTMELMTGSLASVLREGAKLTPVDAVSLIEKIARGMMEVHAADFLHRDLKPGNILLDSKGNPKIADFGLVKTNAVETGASTIRQLTLVSAVLGTPSYMALEQAEARHLDIDSRTDVYGLGAILFHCLAGRPPFLGKTSYHIVQTILQEEAPSPRQFTPDLPRTLEAICLKCLAKDQNSRYQSMLELADDLLAWKNGQRPKVRPISRLRPLKRFVFRERKSILWAASTAIVGVAAFFASNRAIGDRSVENPNQGPIFPEALTPDEANDAEAAKMRQELDALEKVWLLGPTGGPRYRSRLHRTVETVKSSFGDEYCVETISQKFVELMREKDVPNSFILEGEVLQEISPEAVGLTGMYIGRWVAQLNNKRSRAHWLEVVYNDAYHGPRIPDLDRIYLRSVLNVSGEKPSPEYLPLVLGAGDFDPVTIAAPPVWRKIRIIVTSEGVAVQYSPGDRLLTMGGTTLDNIREKLKNSYGERTKLETDPDRWSNKPFEGGLGLLIHKCRSSFRNVWIQKLADKSEP